MTKIPSSKELQPETPLLGEPFLLNHLVLPRPACAYGVQRLGTDQLLDPSRLALIPVRNIGRAAFFNTHGAAVQSTLAWLNLNDQASTPLAIVPLGWDDCFERVILIHGVLMP